MPQTPYILSLETSTPVLSVALHQGGKLMTSMEHHVAREHNKRLISMVDNVLKLMDYTLAKLDAIAICSGPGSYTGLRIGASFAKGLCLGAGLPLLAVDSLTPMLQTAQRHTIDGVYIVLLHAGRGHAYTLVADAHGQIMLPMKKLAIQIDSFASWLTKGLVYFCGDCQDYYPSLREHAHARFLPSIYPKAKAMGQLTYTKFANQDFVDLVDFEPSFI